MIINAGNLQSSRPVGPRRTRPRRRAAWQVPLWGQGLALRLGQRLEAEQALQLARAAACWGEAWLARARGAPRGISPSSAMTWAISSACTQMATVFPYLAE